VRVEGGGPGRPVAVLAEQREQLSTLGGEPCRVLGSLVEQGRDGAPARPPRVQRLLLGGRGALLLLLACQRAYGVEVGTDPLDLA
jgi:hypothetical protein